MNNYHFEQRGDHRLVKVVNTSALNGMAQDAKTSGGPIRISGCLTKQKYLYGKTSGDIEKALGLRSFELGDFCHVYGLAGIPSKDIITYLGTCERPMGKDLTEANIAEIMKARADYRAGRNLYRRSITPVLNAYWPGSDEVEQWFIPGVHAVASSGLVASVTKVMSFPRPAGGA